MSYPIEPAFGVFKGAQHRAHLQLLYQNLISDRFPGSSQLRC